MAKTSPKDEAELPAGADLERLLEQARSLMSDPRLERLYATMLRLSAEPPQSLLLEGGSAAERSAAGLYWAALLNCAGRAPEGSAGAPLTGAAGKPCLNCPSCIRILSRMHRDLFFFDGTAGNIKIDEIRALRAQLGESPREGKKRVALLFEGQALGEPAANALLKSLEEPAQDSLFVLTAPQRERLLPTLVSRSWTLTLPWPQSGGPDAAAALGEWAGALLEFAGTGRGWMERTARRGSLDAGLVMQLVLCCQRALTAALSGNESLAGTGLAGLAGAFARLSPRGQGILSEVLAECQDSLFYTVNPALVADWLATRLYFLLARETAA